MRRPLQLALFLILTLLPSVAQTLTLSENSASGAPDSIPIGTPKSISARVTGVNNKGGTWTSTGGTLFNANCAITVNGLCRVRITSTTTTSVLTITFTPADGTVSPKSTHLQFVATPTPTNTGTTPNFILTASNITALRARATGSNLTFSAIKTRATILFNNDIAAGWALDCSGGGPTVNPGYPPFIQVWFYSYMLAMNDSSKNWSCGAHDELLYTMTNVKNGSLPFGANVWSDLSYYATEGTAWSLQFGAISSPTDIDAVRSFAYWALPTLDSFAIGVVPFPTNYNSSYQWNGVPDVFQLTYARASGNNYTLSKLVWNVGFGLMFKDDTTNDPLIPTGPGNTCGAARGQICSDYTAGSLHAYWTLATQTLMKMYGHLEQKEIAYDTLNTAYPSGGFGSSIQCQTQFGGATQECLGDGIDGEGSEGDWYSYSFFRPIVVFNFIRGAGYDDPRAVSAGGYGPQLGVMDISWWDEYDWSSRQLLTGSYNASQTFMGPAYGYVPTGDANTIQRYPIDYQTMAEELVSDTYTGRVDRTNDLLWFTMNMAPGGYDGTGGGCTGTCGFDSNMANDLGLPNALGLFVTQSVNDPQTLTPTDPGPNYPLTWWNNSYNQHLNYRTGWTNSDTVFSVFGNNTMINHEAPTLGMFDLWANGGIITRGSLVYTDYVYPLYSTGRQNMVQIYDQPGVAAGNLDTCFAENTGYYGGQLMQAYQQGLSLNALHSEMPTYAFYAINETPAQNGCWNGSAFQFNDTTQAYRDILYLPGSKNVVWYDRDTTAHTASTKTLFLNTSGNGTATSNRVTWSTASGSNGAAFTSLLPAGATVAASKLVGYVTLTGPHSSLQNTTTMQGVCTATYMDGTTANVTSSASWESDTPSVATVNSAGLITAVSVGTANIYCAVGPTNNLPAVFDPLEPPPFYSAGALTVVSGSSSGTLTGSTNTTQTGDREIVGNLSVTPSGSPLSANFLSGLEWGASGFTAATMTLVQSSAGQGYDCDLIAGNKVACFMRSLTTFSGTTIPVSAAGTLYVADLTPNTSYTASGAGVGASVTSDVGGVAVLTPTGAGSVVLSPGSGPPAAPVNLSGHVQISGNAKVN